MSPFTRATTCACLALAALLAFSGCTVDRIRHDTVDTVEWLRLKHGAELHAAGRWQLPRNSSIRVREVEAGPDPAWLAAAQQGVNAVFPAPATPGEGTFDLLVSWPQVQRSPFAVQVALMRDGLLVEAAQLEVSPRWLAGAGPRSVENAFRELAASYRPRH